ncbi:hypothetical protein NVP1152O_088 [Vibrio phage 1.152.O._10N.222.46.E1]|uniref:Uncharacterized protein n=4 Tax=Nahantvirus 49C7 TaxID=2846601 RepID=A0A2I7RBH6_9CAUD|nr:hypothetical protein NVP1025O_087 [Vibrio phage 1.025.O._10N.222.46.B6]AUR90820.1 hypothetical protein NVP1150O_087 [Vibrio phage 1.150.O._10N.222.46.A6]AUR90993.1 hypothetical protein NVP1152O_088 [Vibrio phage 1.152.O._10N.222.46.E1]AUS02461.1 hypothetical protein NVP2130O_087 [Vibrio phage 2.130.O._10N.222.46.C2]
MIEPNQKQYLCPMCEGDMLHKRESGVNSDYSSISCKNENCDYYQMSWDVATLESYPINQEQRLVEILEDV